jgi:hypothetical protein
MDERRIKKYLRDIGSSDDEIAAIIDELQDNMRRIREEDEHEKENEE